MKFSLWYHVPWEVSREDPDSPRRKGQMQRKSGWPSGRIQRPEVKHPFPRKPGSGMWTEIKQEPGTTHLDKDFPTLFCPTQVSWFMFHE